MPRTPKDDPSDEQTRRDTAGEDHAAIARLEQALDAEVKTSAGLRDSLDELRAKVDQIAASFEQRLEEATRRSTTAEHKIADQQKRLVALGNGREESMKLLADARAELSRVSIERDKLHKQLARIDDMQTATITLGEEEIERSQHPAGAALTRGAHGEPRRDRRGGLPARQRARPFTRRRRRGRI